MTHPRSAADLVLAPVAVEIDGNLQRLRHLGADEIAAKLDLELDRPESPAAGRDERQARILQVALRNVNLHGAGARRSAVTAPGCTWKADQ